MRIQLRRTLFIVWVSCAAAVSWAQDEIPTRVNAQNRTGDLPFSATIGSDIEHVDLASGNLVVKIPIVSSAGRGMDFEFGLVYNAMLWATAPRIDAAGQQRLEWNLEHRTAGIALGWSETRPSVGGVTQSFPCTANTQGSYFTNFIYQDPGGAKHALAVQRTNSAPANCVINDTVGPDLNGAGIRASVGSNGLASIVLADGTQFTGAQFRDSNGNLKTADIDTLGRSGVQIVNQTGRRLYKVFDSNGVQQTYTVNFGAVNLQTAFNQTVIGCSPQPILPMQEFSGSREAITSIVLPNGTSYVFQYENNSYGALTRIDLPSGGSISYVWSTLPSGPQTHRYVSSRTVSVNGQSHTWTISNTSAITVTDPAGNQSLYTPGPGGVIAAASFYQGTASGTPVRRYDVLFDTDGDPLFDDADGNIVCWNPSPEPRAPRPRRITTTLDDGKVSKTEIDYETFSYTYHPRHAIGQYGFAPTFTATRGNVGEIREYAFGQGAPGSLVRYTQRTYLHNANTAYLPFNIVDKVLTETLRDAAGVQKARTEYEYDTTGLLTSTGAPQHDDTNYPASFAYRGNATRVKHWRNTDGALLTTVYTYDTLGNIRSITNPRSFTTTYAYSDRWANTGCAPPADSRAYVTDIQNVQTHRVELAYYPCSGLRQARRDENDILNNRAGTTFSYDLMGRPTQTAFPDGGQTSMTYSDQIPFVATATTKINGMLNLVDEVQYDGLNRPRVTRRTSDPQGAVFTRSVYDFAGRVVQSWNPTRCNPDVGNCGETTYGITQTVYDALGRVTKVIPPDGSFSANNITTAYSGNSAIVTDQAGKARRSVTDAQGRLSEVVEDPAGAAYSTLYAYDHLDNLTTVTQGAQTRNFVYDSLSQLRSATNPESGFIQYTYDANGNVATRTDARTTLTTYAYDSLDRLTGKVYTIAGTTAATPNVTYAYDGLTGTCNSKGRLTLVSSAASTSTVECFDAMGRPTQTRQTTSGLGYLFNYGYDLVGNLITEAYPSGKTIGATLDGAGRLSRLQRQDGVYWAADAGTTIQYTPHGAPRRVRLGNGLWEETRFNVRLQPAQTGVGQTPASTLEEALDTTKSNRLLLEFGYGLGTANNSNVLSQAIRTGTTTFSQTYTYDALNRIQTAQETGGWSQSYVNDRYGNMKQAGVAYTFVEGTNRLNPGGGYQYDAAGNLTVDPSAGSFAYDAENRLKGFNAGNAQLNAAYEYDGEGRRVKKVQGGATTLFVYDAAGRLAAEYSTAAPAAGGTRYMTGDTLGSNRLVTDSAGNVVSRHDYYPYGEEITASVNGRAAIGGYSTPDSIRQRFTGKERDAETNLDFFGARYYSAARGRWITPDWSASPKPIPYADLYDPQTLNLYGYVRNSPLSKSDPDGHCFWDLCIGEGAAVYVAAGATLAAAAYFATPQGREQSQAFFSAAIGGISSSISSFAEKVNPYDVGVSKVQKAGSKHDGLDIHHVPQSRPAEQIIKGYDSKTAPTIALPEAEHNEIPADRGEAKRSPRDQLAKDVKDLRNRTNAPSSKIKELIDKLKEKYPEFEKAPKSESR